MNERRITWWVGGESFSLSMSLYNDIQRKAFADLVAGLVATGKHPVVTEKEEAWQPV